MAIQNPPLRSFLILCTGISLTACSGGGGGGTTGTVNGIAGPEQVSVVSADTTELGGGGATNGGSVAPESGAWSPPANSAYVNDDAHIFIFDPSMENLETINSILCETSQTAYSEMVNEGPYLAQITLGECETGGNQDSGASDSGQSSGGGNQIDLFTVDCTRSSNSGAQLVQFWVPEEGRDGEPAATIHAEMTLTEAASLADPFGQFQLNFAGVPDAGGDILDPSMWGVLETLDSTDSSIGFNFYSSQGNVNVAPGNGEFAHLAQVAVIMDETQESGAARIRVRERHNFPPDGDSGIKEGEWVLAFDSTHIKRKLDNEATVTLSRTDYNTNVWRYNLYHHSGPNEGERVELSSGFGFRTEDDDYGWIGYHGMWVPDDVTVDSGDTIYRDSFGDEAVESYTLVQAPGKLIKNTKSTMLLTELSGQNFRWWDFNENSDYLLEYSTGAWWRLATWDNESHSWTDITPVELDVNTEAGGWLGMWSDTLGGRVNFVLGDTFITYFAESIVNASDDIFTGSNGTVPLFGYFQCLDAELTATEVESGAIFLNDSMNVQTPHEYLFDSSDLTLYWDDVGTLRQVGLATGQVPTTGPNMWGMHSGPLVTSTETLTEVWDIWDVDTFYAYETGHNDWNRYSAVIDEDEDMVVFDPPLQFLYTHDQTSDRNDDNSFDGQNFFFEYGGNGNLHGIPHDGFDIDGDNEPDRWYPRFSIEDGVFMGPTGSEYVVRAMEMEQTLQADPGGAPTLSLNAGNSLTLPDGSNYTTPTNGAQPAVTDPPAVIDGTVQGTN